MKGVARSGLPDLEEDAAVETPVTEVQVTAHGALLDVVNSQHLRVVYQPIVRMEDGGLFGYEALLRCQDPRFKDPMDLLTRAMECRRTGALGRAVRQIAIPQAPPVPLFINVHPDEFRDSWLRREDDPLFRHDADIYIEVTETVPLTDFGRGHALFETLSNHPKLHFVVDDLGAGFSNLKRIADLEPELVKVDRELVTGLATSSRQRTLLGAIVKLCEELGAKVVAEGIETVDEYLAVRDAGAHFGQGFLLARPAFPGPRVYWKP